MAKPKSPPDVVAIPDWRTDATRDTSFLQIMRSSAGVVGSRSDVVIFAVMLVIGLSGVVWAGLQTPFLSTTAATAKMVQQWASFATSVSVSILGFLIAGFSVFATVTRPELFHILAQFRLSSRKISEFKFVFYNFIFIFGNYIFHLSYCVVISFLFVKGSPLWFIGVLFHQLCPKIVDILAAMSAVVLVSYTVYMLLLLRSFLWNLYQTLLFAIFYDTKSAN